MSLIGPTDSLPGKPPEPRPIVKYGGVHLLWLTFGKSCVILYAYTDTLGEQDGIHTDHQQGDSHAIPHKGRGRAISKPEWRRCYFATDPRIG